MSKAPSGKSIIANFALSTSESEDLSPRDPVAAGRPSRGWRYWCDAENP